MGAAVLLVVYGVLIEVGGLIAFSRTKSRVSLVVAGVSGGVLLLCGALAWIGMGFAAYAGLVMTLLLAALFALRFRRTGKIRPAGFMMAVSLLVAVGLGYLLLT